MKPESHEPASFPSDPKPIGESSPEVGSVYSTNPVLVLNAKLDDVRFAGVPAPPLIPVIEPVPSSWLAILVLIHCAIEVSKVCVPPGPAPQSDAAFWSLFNLYHKISYLKQ